MSRSFMRMFLPSERSRLGALILRRLNRVPAWLTLSGAFRLRVMPYCLLSLLRNLAQRPCKIPSVSSFDELRTGSLQRGELMLGFSLW